MYTTVASQDWAEKLIIETAIIMLSSPEPNIAYGNERAWEYINTHLMGENDKKACLHVLKGEPENLPVLVPMESGLDLKDPRNFAPTSQHPPSV